MTTDNQRTPCDLSHHSDGFSHSWRRFTPSSLQCQWCGEVRDVKSALAAPEGPPAPPTDQVKAALERLDQAVNDIEANARGLSGKDLERNYEAAKDALIAALHPAPAPPTHQWQPIETAPKDREILTYREKGLISVAIYFPHGKAQWCVTDGMHLLGVTHWMPLPEPPK